MTNVTAFSVLALTVGLSLTRPSFGGYRVQPPIAAIIGATLTVGLGLVSASEAAEALRLLSRPVLTIISLMAMTLIAEQIGVFRLVAWRVATAANGDARKLFGYLFFTGTVTGAIFTNDAAVLIFTPMVFNLVEEVAQDDWTQANKLPYYFAVLYVANLVAPLVISNPINIIVTSLFDIGFAEYASWMLLPAVASMVVSFFALRFYFRAAIPARCALPRPVPRHRQNRRFMVVTGVVLMLTLFGLFAEQWIGVPIWLVASCGAALLLALYRLFARSSLMPIAHGIGWDVIVFVMGIFVVANGLRNAGLTDQIGRIIVDSANPNLLQATTVTGFVAATCSAIMNNHPTAGTMALAIEELGLSSEDTRMLVFSALVGGDLGPKMLPIGSLAALLWFRMLRHRGVDVSYLLYVRVGIPVSIAAIAVSILILNLERIIVDTLS